MNAIQEKIFPAKLWQSVVHTEILSGEVGTGLANWGWEMLLTTGHAYFTKANRRLWEFWTNSAETPALEREAGFLGRSLSIPIRPLLPSPGPLTIPDPTGFSSGDGPESRGNGDLNGRVDRGEDSWGNLCQIGAS
ncbi:hypothetical protein NG796_01225 [Laspinema sp. A4]|uniref:hypothetical protein n=1 Tax=Laspinema sp. D2d TaxID=2953686 RepID=UPI0021BB3FE6|nr:hypothetical protein [Laspinema sp. D2d]MCT7981908.1 hypothetical protein [Laspinema sp. D2d]